MKTLQSTIALSAMCAVGTAASADVVLTSGEAFIDGFSFTGVAAGSATIDERIDWDGSGSGFNATIDEERTLTGTFSGFTVDNTIAQSITQNTTILGGIGDSFRGVSTTASAFGSIEKRGPNGGSSNNFLDSLLSLRFTVEEPGFTYDLSGVLESTSTSPLTSSVLLRRFTQPDAGGVPVETIIISGVSGTTFPFEFDRSGSLTPGFWLLTLRINGSVDGAAPPPSVSTASFGWDVDFTIVPTPAATGVLALAGLIATRRRRGR